MQNELTTEQARHFFEIGPDSTVRWRVDYGRAKAGQKIGSENRKTAFGKYSGAKRVQVSGKKYTVDHIKSLLTKKDYTAEDIKILKHEEAVEKFDWVRAEELARKYAWVSPDFIARMLEACQLSGFSQELAIKRYLDEDKSIHISEEFYEVYKELVNDRYRPAEEKKKK